ncbi:MAG TPA: alpha-L-fucosidase [bacterium]|nr:alpha-L-fucosidase [bacterium]
MYRFNDGRDWFFEKRFGLFIHWGLYSVNEWHEQELFRMNHMGMTLKREEYALLAARFNPVKFDPDRWLDIAQEAGMEYICFTSKHHDGFCMWDTRETDFNIMNTPYGKDVLAMIANACTKRNFPLCIYYSVPDMYCRYFPNSGTGYDYTAPQPGDEPDAKKYVGFVKAQVKELCTNYGRISGFWWDGGLRHGIYDESVNALVRSLQPGIIIDNRGFDNKGDFETPERTGISQAPVKFYMKPTEHCNSVGEQSWGYRKNEDYFSLGYLTRSMIQDFAKGGNYLLNVGPRPDGTFPDRAVTLLKGIGSWYRRVKESFTGANPAPGFTDNGSVLLTKKGNSLYVHLLNADSSGVTLNPMDVLPRKASLLNTGEELEMDVELMPWASLKSRKKYLHIWNIPVDKLANEAIVLKLEFDNLPEKQ